MDYNLHLGERLDISADGRTYVSSIQEITAEGTLKIDAPMYRSITLNLRPGDRVDAVYYRPQGLCSFVAGVTRSLEENGLKMAEIEITSPIRKFQRREYVRLETNLAVHMALLAAPEAVRTMPTRNALQLSYDKTEAAQPIVPAEGVTADISGGGLRAFSPLTYPAGALIECTLHLRSGEVFRSQAKIIRSDRTDSKERLPYVVSIQFVNVNEEARRRVIKYIFDEQIKSRRVTG